MGRKVAEDKRGGGGGDGGGVYGARCNCTLRCSPLVAGEEEEEEKEVGAKEKEEEEVATLWVLMGGETETS